MVTTAELKQRQQAAFQERQAKRTPEFKRAREAQFRVPKGQERRGGRVKRKSFSKRKFTDPVSGRKVSVNIEKGPGFEQRLAEQKIAVARQSIAAKEARGEVVSRELKQRFAPTEKPVPTRAPKPVTRPTQITPEETALTLAAAQQRVKASPKFAALRARRLAEARQKITAPTSAERKIRIAEQDVTIGGVVTPFRPRRVTGPGVGTKARELEKIREPSTISAVPFAGTGISRSLFAVQEVAKRAGAQLVRPFIGAGRELRSARVDITAPLPPTVRQQLRAGQITPEIPKQPTGIPAFFRRVATVGAQVGEQAPTARALVGTALVVGTVGVFAPAIVTSPLVTIPAFEVAKTVTTGQLSTPTRVVETALQVGLFELAGRGAQLGARQVSKVVSRAKLARLEAAQRIPAPQPIAVGLPKGQTQFVKITESGRVVAQFGRPAPRPTFQRITESGRVLSTVRPTTQTTFVRPTESGVPINLLGFRAPPRAPTFPTPKTATQVKLTTVKQGFVTQRFGQGFETRPFTAIERVVAPSRTLGTVTRSLFRSKKAQLVIQRVPTTQLQFRTVPRPTTSTQLISPTIIGRRLAPITLLGREQSVALRVEQEERFAPVTVLADRTLTQFQQPTRQRFRKVSEAITGTIPRTDVTLRTPTTTFTPPSTIVETIPDLVTPSPPTTIIITEPLEEIIKEPPAKTTPFLLPQLEQQPKQLKRATSQGFDSFAKEKGKNVKLNEKSMTRNRAINSVLDALDNTPSATGSIRKGKQITRRPDIPIDSRIFKFTQKNNTFQEKNRFRIDSRGELEGITIKGLLAQRRRGFNFI